MGLFTTETRRHGERRKIERKTFETRRNGVSGGKIIINQSPRPRFSPMPPLSKESETLPEVTREPRSNEVAEERMINNPPLTPFLRVSKVLVPRSFAVLR